MKAILDLLPGADELSRKFYLACLSDLLENPRALLTMQNTSWSQGIETLLNTCLASEPLATSLIFNRLHKDVNIRNQISSMMSKEYVDEVLN